jgi:hypothetical protein
MAKLTVNIGTSANDRTGDNLRTAFNKINTNFTELYTALGLDDASLNLGAFEFTGSVMTTTDSSAITIDQAVTVSSDLTVGGDVVPSTDLGSSLGSATKRFKDLYISNNTIFLGNTTLGVSAGGTLEVGGSSVSSVIDYNDIQNTPTVPTLTSELTNDSGFVTAADTFNFNITGDDSTVRTVQSGSTIGIVGATGITTASDADGNITITGTAQDFAFSSLTGKPTTVAGYGITDALTSVPAQSFASLTGKPTTISGYGITDALTSVPAQSFASLTGKPTTISGYGITDAQSALVSGTSIKTINGTSLLGSGDVTISASGADLSAVNQNYTPDTDNAYDLGIEAGNWLRSGYYRTSVVIGSGQYANATLTYNANGHLQSSAGINTSSLYSNSYMSIEPQYGGLIFWMDGDAGGGTLGYSSNNGSNEMTWSGDMYSNGPTYQLDGDQANLQIGAEVTKTISDITLGATTSLSFSDPYYFNPNSTVTITGVVGTTELNNQTYFINSSNELFTDAALTTPLNSSAFTPYVSGGTAVVAPRATASLPVLHSAPATPKSGMMAVADGTNWNPTSTGTETMVIYLGGAWRTIANA